MTPKEKALELCQQFGMTSLFEENCNDGVTLPLNVSKKCTSIAVDEIIAFIKLAFSHINIELASPSIKYLEEVKQEIEKL